MSYNFHTLPNGIRIVHKQSPNLVAHFGILINTGSRDEAEDEYGMAHFIEHSIFKGTRKRRAYHILSRLEDVGGEMNAYTTKEETCVHASFLGEYYKRTMELISDIVFQSTFPEGELQKEKEVVIEEINSYKDNPSEQIYDEFEEQVFANNPLAHGILGTEESLKGFGIAHIRNFMDHKYNTDHIVLSSVGNIPFVRLVKLAETYFGMVSSNSRVFSREKFSGYKPEAKQLQKNTYQAHCVIGAPAYGFDHENRLGLYLLNNMLGGPGMNSRLNLSLREKKGFTYNIESNYTPYSDTGIFNIYFGTDQNNLAKSIQLVKKELRDLKDKKLGTLQLSKAKKQLIGQQAIASENLEGYMLSMGKSMLVFNQVETLEEVNKKIEGITAGKIQDIANEIFEDKNLSMLIYNP
jgi:predicted Zn-dependent peptidase